jgi:hypothetical protein
MSSDKEEMDLMKHPLDIIAEDDEEKARIEAILDAIKNEIEISADKNVPIKVTYGGLDPEIYPKSLTFEIGTPNPCIEAATTYTHVDPRSPLLILGFGKEIGIYIEYKTESCKCSAEGK